MNSLNFVYQVVFASPAISELLGVKPEEAEGRDWADFIHRASPSYAFIILHVMTRLSHCSCAYFSS
jgi:PAS domain-containing protein